MKSFIVTVLTPNSSFEEKDYEDDQRENEIIAKEIFKYYLNSVAIVLHNSRTQILITRKDLKKGLIKRF